jgi:hypothetical protein
LTRELALSLVNQLEIDSGIHRVALSTGTDPENEVVAFGRIKVCNFVQSRFIFALDQRRFETSDSFMAARAIEHSVQRY